MKRMFVLAAALAALSAGCGATPWVQARSAVSATDAALDVLGGAAVRGLLPEGAVEDFDIAVTAGRGVVDLGGDLVDTWEAARAQPQRWSWWVDKALRWAATIADVIKGCGVAMPEQVALAIGGLQLLLPVIAAAAGG